MTVTPEQDFVLKTIKSRDVHFVRFWFTDVLGRMKSFAVIPSELEDAFADGMGFDGSCRSPTRWRACSAACARPTARRSRATRVRCWPARWRRRRRWGMRSTSAPSWSSTTSRTPRAPMCSTAAATSI